MSVKRDTKKPNSGFTPLANSTTSGSRLRPDLDSTGLSATEASRKLDCAYNEYLQAFAKKKIVSTSFQNYEKLLKQQISYQQHEIKKMKKKSGEIKTNLEYKLRTNELVNILTELDEKLKGFEKLTQSHNMNRLMNLSNILEGTCKKLKLVGVESFKNKGEWLSLINIMNELCKYLQNFFRYHKSVKEFELIDQITISLKEALELQEKIQEQIAVLSIISRVSSVQYMVKIKNSFDVLELATV